MNFSTLYLWGVFGIFGMNSVSTKKLRYMASSHYHPSTPNQREYVKTLQNTDKSMVVAIGPAGSGKTLFACIQAIELLKNSDIRKIVITRPLVSVQEEELGFLPGNIVNKMDPWTRPVLDIFTEFYSIGDINNFIKCGVLEIAPLAFMRGRTFHDTFVLADEMQNSSPSQMLMLATRMGHNSKLVLTGDLAQSDRPSSFYKNGGNHANGLQEFIDKFYVHKLHVGKDIAERDIDIIQLDRSDVKRSSLVSHVLDIYDSPC